VRQIRHLKLPPLPEFLKEETNIEEEKEISQILIVKIKKSIV
jgi:hypothetical protein